MPALHKGRFTPNNSYDVAVVGGGIHGLSMALEACKRGLSVILIQGNDLASGASGIQRGLFGGGFQSLSQLNLTAVKANFSALKKWHENHANSAAPVCANLIANHPLRSAKLVKTGLAIYHRLAGSSADLCRNHSRETFSTPYFAYTLRPARRILDIATEARALGADIFPYTRVNAAIRQKNCWQLTVNSSLGSNTNSVNVNAKMLINCCGWLANTFLTDVLGVVSRAKAHARKAGLIYVSGPLDAPPLPLTLQANNKQFISMLAVTPQHYVIGPFSDEELGGSKQNALAALQTLLSDQLGEEFSQWVKTLHIDEIKWINYAQVSDPSGGAHRGDFLQDSILDLNNPKGGAPLLNVFGIDIAKHANLARQGFNILAPFSRECASHVVPLTNKSTTPPTAFNNPIINRWQTTYAQGVNRLLKDANLTCNSTVEDFGVHFGEDLYQCEVDYLIRYEWAITAEDILWRRGDWGPWFPESGKQMLADYLAQLT